MNCDQVRESLVEYLLDEVNADTKSAIYLHLRQGCPSCLSNEREIAAGIDVMFHALPDDALTLDQREAILAGATNPTTHLRIHSDSSHSLATHAETLTWTPVFQHLLVFAAGLFLMLCVTSLTKVDHSKSAVAKGNSSLTSDSFAVDPSTIPKGSELAEERYAKSLLVSMRRANVSSMIEGHILWDALNHEVHFFGSGIADPPSGMNYVLWIMDGDNHVLATHQLSVDSTGRCKATATSRMSNVRFVFITLESKLARFDRPSGNIELSLDSIRFDSSSL